MKRSFVNSGRTACATLFCWSLLIGSAASAPMWGPRPQPYPDVVRATRAAAQAVLDRAGAESCLRGKLTNVLLLLSASCAAAGERTELCSLADRAVVVTPWTLTFMEDTARELLALSTASRNP